MVLARFHTAECVPLFRPTALASNIAPAAGDKVLDVTQNEVGQIVRVAPNMENGFDALIELRIEAKEAGNMTCNNVSITLNDMPYAV